MTSNELYSHFLLQTKLPNDNREYNNLIKALLKQDAIQEYIQKSPQSVSNTTLSVLPFLFFLRALFNREESWCLVFETDTISDRIYQELLSLSTIYQTFDLEQDLTYLPDWDISPYTNQTPDLERQRLHSKAMYSIATNKKVKMITSISAILRKTPNSQYLQEHTFEIKVGQSYNTSNLQEKLCNLGYKKVDMVTSYGEFTFKGSILDIFSHTYNNPIRIDFWGDDVENIHFFNPSSQKSYKELSHIKLIPQSDFLFDKKEHLKTIKKLLHNSDLPPSSLPHLLNTKLPNLDGLFDLYPHFFPTNSIFETFPSHTHYFLYQPHETITLAEKKTNEYTMLYEKYSERYGTIAPKLSELFISTEVLSKKLNNMYAILKLSQTGNELNMKVQSIPNYYGKISKFIESIPTEQQLYIMTSIKEQEQRLQHILERFKETKTKKSLSFLSGTLLSGFQIGDISLITEKDILGKKESTPQFLRHNTKAIDSFTDLKGKDYIVHINYGVGQFQNIKRMQVANYERDFLEILYADNDKLFIPIEHIKYIHKYIGSVENPKLDYLGKKSTWNKKKEKAQQTANKTAEQLLKIYAQRERSKGILYPKDTHFQKEFEASFPYTETLDQLTAIQHIKQDMESEKLMDRLICGDVGFGKTEVAMRATFKAIMAGKQVAILCPTTVLTYQHFTTFSKRFEKYPVKVTYLSRFRSSKENQYIQEQLVVGKIDVIIGTHSLLSKKIKFKNLGLLVVDEEQKFGVKHKEKIKEMKSNIDCITLTATPIPRTLQMSLIGLRDLSLITTPPNNRKKIETFILEDNEEIITQAIQKEVSRGGQIYILHNKIRTIEAQAQKMQQLYPKVSIAVLHGQMNKEHIEDILIQFYDNQYNILVSTTIIESGIDIPNVNTLIVLHAEQFGLSQLYQLKGRVGRSNRQAYAYFFYPKNKSINEIAVKRLQSLQEYDELGSGFKIAMKDLEIRGAGNLLGKEQSGEIIQVGFELYVQLLQKAISKHKKEETLYHECQINIMGDYYIPNDYIADLQQRMEFYKKIIKSTTQEELIHVEHEIKDRFGSLPTLMNLLFIREKVRIISEVLFLEKVISNNNQYTLIASNKTNIPLERILYLFQKQKRIILEPTNPKHIYIPYINSQKGNKEDNLSNLLDILVYLHDIR